MPAFSSARLGIFLQFVPLSVFLYVALRTGTSPDWPHAFIMGGITAILQLLCIRWFLPHQVINRIILSANIYLIVGGIATLTHIGLLLQLLSDLKEIGVFITLLGVGLLSTLYTPAGFIGNNTAPRPLVRRYSWGLLMLSMIATGCAIAFQGRLTYSATIPFIVLSLTCRYLNKRLDQTDVQRTSGI